jgi:hypothetical protein
VKYSVWNNGTRSYDYYATSGVPEIHAGAPPRVRTGALGATPDQAAWPLPAGARRVGSGDVPQGRIASLGGDSAVGIPSVIIYAAIGYFAWRALR